MKTYDGSIYIDTKIDSQGYEKGLAKMKSDITGFLKKMSVVVTGFLAGFSASTIKFGSDFETSLAKIGATLGKTADEMKNLDDEMQAIKNTARDWGARTIYSATEAANAMQYLIQSGMDATTAMEALGTVLYTAQAAGLELADSADMIANAMFALGLPVSDLNKFSDQLIVTSQKANTNVAMLGEAMIKLGANGRQASGGTAELAAAMGMLANNGIKGSEAGTILRNIIKGVNGQNKLAYKTLKELGIASYDATGKLRPLADIMEDLRNKLQSMSTAQQEFTIGRIFMSYSSAGAKAIMNNVDALRELEAELNNASGVAENNAKIMENTLKGAWANLESAYEEISQKIMEQINPALQDGVKAVNDFLLAFGESEELDELSESLENLIRALTEFATDVLPALTTAIGVMADAIAFVAKNFKELIVAFVSYKAGIIAAQVATIGFGNALKGLGLSGVIGAFSKIPALLRAVNIAFIAAGGGARGFFAAVRTGLGSTGIGLLFVALGYAIMAIVDNFDNLCIAVEKAWIWIRKLFAGEETTKKLNERLDELNDQLDEIRKKKDTKITIDLEVTSGNGGWDKEFDKLNKQRNKVMKDLKELQKQKEAALTLHNLGNAQMSLDTSKWDVPIAELKAKLTELDNAARETGKSVQKTIEDTATSVGEKTEEMSKHVFDINQTIVEAWQDFGVEVGNALEGLGEALGAGISDLGDLCNEFSDAMFSIVSAMGDLLIKEGIFKELQDAFEFDAASGTALIAAGVALKVAAGLLRGTLQRQKFANGGIVGGQSYSGDHVLANVNSGEMILNAQQQKRLFDMANGHSGGGASVNIQVINHAGAQVTTTASPDGRDVKVLIEKMMDNYMQSPKGVRMVKTANAYTGV